jgi:hypothetical protein
MRTGSRALLPVVLALVSCRQMDTPAVDHTADAALESAVARTPEMEPADLYKLLHQGWLGPGHMAPSLETARHHLDVERSRLSLGGQPEPRLEALPGPHGLVRVHLRAWPVESDDTLASAFVITAETVVPDPEGLVRELVRVGAHLETLGLPFDENTWRAFVDARVAEGLPAVHHSEGYRTRYAPAYRVVLRSLAE